MPADPISLLELNSRIREGMRKLFPRGVWIVAEVGEMSVNYSGHCYMELVQKDRKSGQIVARAKATVWAATFRNLRPFFETTTGQRWEAGINLMIEVTAEFHEAYGFSLNVRDVNPTYTVGEMALQRLATLKALEEAGILDMNRELDLPFPVQRIAVISSDTAAGFGDFIHHLHDNPSGLVFYSRLFPAVVQGTEAEASIIGALQSIYRYESCFDVVAILRGGGAKTDLHCFDSRDLAFHIAQFPLPVLTGIGHDRDESVADRVAWRAFKTPTAVAGFLIEQAQEALDQTEFLAGRLETLTRNFFDRQKKAQNLVRLEASRITQNALSNKLKQLNSFLYRSKTVSTRIASLAGEELRMCRYRLSRSVTSRIEQEKGRLILMPALAARTIQTRFQHEKLLLNHIEIRNQKLDPALIMSRGYALVTDNGHPIRSVRQLSPGKELILYLSDGKARTVTREIYPLDGSPASASGLPDVSVPTLPSDPSGHQSGKPPGSYTP